MKGNRVSLRLPKSKRITGGCESGSRSDCGGIIGSADFQVHCCRQGEVNIGINPDGEVDQCEWIFRNS